ncbi:unnamed protein product [Sphagnum troendelagicum]|jgi:hypothetical protein|uniref:Uncharacterized protein n=1 Tax=Sphagnum jensenii TaxID=128206 RepID=A0ABP0XIM5_9BRYO
MARDGQGWYDLLEYMRTALKIVWILTAKSGLVTRTVRWRRAACGGENRTSYVCRKGQKELQLVESDEHAFFQAIPAYYTSAQSREYYALSETYAIEQQQQQRQQ